MENWAQDEAIMATPTNKDKLTAILMCLYFGCRGALKLFYSEREVQGSLLWYCEWKRRLTNRGRKKLEESKIKNCEEGMRIRSRERQERREENENDEEFLAF